MSSPKRRLSQNISTSATKLRLDSINKILKINSVKARKQKNNAIARQVSRVALSELLKNTSAIVSHDLPDFKTFLSNKENVNIFREFLKSQYCQENIDFYLACEKYRQLDPERVGKEMVKFMATQIYNDFLSEDARQPVNINYNCVKVIKASMKDPKPDLLCDAQSEIFNLMKADCYPRFCKTWPLDKDMAKKILTEKPVEATQMSNKTNSTLTSFSSDLTTPLNSTKCSSITSKRSKRRLVLESNKECPSECPYYRVRLPCQTHSRVGKSKERERRMPLEASDLIDQIDLRRIHHVPNVQDCLPSPLPPPLPPKPDDIVTNDIINKKYCPYVGKVFHV